MADLQTAFDKALEGALISRLHSGFCVITATTEDCISETCVLGRCCCRLVSVKTFIFCQPSFSCERAIDEGTGM